MGVLKDGGEGVFDVFGGVDWDATGGEPWDGLDALGGALLEKGVLFVQGDGRGDKDLALGGVQGLSSDSTLFFQGGEGGKDIFRQCKDETIIVEGVDLGVGVLFKGGGNGEVVEGGVGDRAFWATLDNTALL